MKFEVGKFYKTRSGRKCEILFICPQKYRATYPVMVGLEPHVWSVNSDGKSQVTEDYDIVSEWKEPIKIESWVNVYEDGIGRRIFDTKEIADENAIEGKRIACIKVSGVEE
jgi:hypothetical protein